MAVGWHFSPHLEVGAAPCTQQLAAETIVTLEVGHFTGRAQRHAGRFVSCTAQVLRGRSSVILAEMSLEHLDDDVQIRLDFSELPVGDLLCGSQIADAQTAGQTIGAIRIHDSWPDRTPR
jgi:hypothetical protein